MEKFLMIIFWIIFTIYVLRLAFRFLLPWLLGRFIRKVAGNMQQQSPFQQQTYQKNEGEMYVKTDTTDKPKIDPEVGEYIDFEEIKETDKK